MQKKCLMGCATGAWNVALGNWKWNYQSGVQGRNEMQQLDSGLGVRNGTSKSELPVADGCEEFK